MSTLYVRTSHGQTEDLPVAEALAQFFGDEGYRIAVPVGNGQLLVIRHGGDTSEREARGCVVTLVDELAESEAPRLRSV